ncbi:hypothetical protein FQN54_007055 [Arachnomyces sp. PD_36]|nr:hypothetical protein FQN54_007055 [Arachnomyces sp. PD_36]
MDGRASKPRPRSKRNEDDYRYDYDDYDKDFEYKQLGGVASLGALATMASWIEKQASSHKVQLAATALVSAAVVAGAIFGVQSTRRKAAVEELKASIPKIDDEHRLQKLTEYGTASPPIAPTSKEDERSAALARRAQMGDYDDELILEQLARNRVFLTDEGLEKLRSSFIIVVGCGGVGSHAAAALARSGVSKIRLIDFDQVTLSSLNRHAVATLADVGTPKVHCIRKRLEQIAPWVSFDCRNQLFGKDAAEPLLAPWNLEGSQGSQNRKPDYVLDCIDNITSKVELLHYCHLNNLPVISSMGAGCKSDPTRVLLGDISTSTDDPLSRSTRRRLKMLGVNSGIPVVFSSEKPGEGKASLLPLPEEEFTKGEVGELGVLPDFRVRILPVLGTMPAVFGYTVANHVICEISGYPNEYCPGGKTREKTCDGILGILLAIEERLVKNVGKRDPHGLRVPVSKEDIGYLIDEVWRGKSAISGFATRLALVRWKRPKNGFEPDEDMEKNGQKFVPLDLGDLVLMTKDEALRHEREVLTAGKAVEDFYDESVLKRVDARMKEEKWFSQYR